MKVFFLQTASAIDAILKQSKDSFKSKSHDDFILEQMKYGFISLFGIAPEYLLGNDYISFYASVANSRKLQSKWAAERNLNSNRNSLKTVLAAQIEEYKPDVIYTANQNFLNKDLKNYLPKASIYALWNASPIPYNSSLDYFDLGISFNSGFLDRMTQLNIPNTESNFFYVNPDLKRKLDSHILKRDIDICFCGRYSPMFGSRNGFLHQIQERFKSKFNVKFFLMSERRIKGLLPSYPLKLLSTARPPIYTEKMLSAYHRSKIVINCHSNITGHMKGNMRFFEALSTGSFLLTDEGFYPPHFVDGVDYVSYKDNNDLCQKIEYFLENDHARSQIAESGHDKVKSHYSYLKGSRNLYTLFSKYL